MVCECDEESDVSVRTTPQIMRPPSVLSLSLVRCCVVFLWVRLLGECRKGKRESEGEREKRKSFFAYCPNQDIELHKITYPNFSLLSPVYLHSCTYTVH